MAESTFADTYTAYAPTSDALDADGMETQGYVAMGTTIGKLQSRTAGLGQGTDTKSREVRVAGVSRQVMEGGLSIPVDAPAPVSGDLGLGWEYELTSGGPNTPSDLLGSRWLVVHSPSKTHMTARRLDVVRLS